MSKSTGKKGGKKIGRNKVRCANYRAAHRREENAIRKCKRLIRRWKKNGIRPADILVLTAKLARLQKGALKAA